MWKRKYHVETKQCYNMYINPLLYYRKAGLLLKITDVNDYGICVLAFSGQAK